jgi:hypothetical protein
MRVSLTRSRDDFPLSLHALTERYVSRVTESDACIVGRKRWAWLET